MPATNKATPPESHEAKVSRLEARVAEMDCRIIDLENTVNAIADPWDYETGLEKTAESCRAIATDCVARLNL